MGPWYTLTPKQSAVAACMLDGMTADESAEAIGISTVAVRRHVEALYRKTGAGKRPQLVAELTKRAGLSPSCLPSCAPDLCSASPDGFCDEGAA